MTTAMAVQTEEHPAVLAGLAPASSSERELRIATRFADLSDEQLAKKEKRYDLLGMGGFLSALATPALSAIPVAQLGFVLSIAGAAGVAATLLSGALVYAHLGNNYSNARKLRRTRARQDRESQLISELKDRFSIELSPAELSRLQYPDAEHDVDGTVRYGTIDRMIQSADGDNRLEQITLVWSDGKFHILRQANAFKSVEGGELR